MITVHASDEKLNGPQCKHEKKPEIIPPAIKPRNIAEQFQHYCQIDDETQEAPRVPDIKQKAIQMTAEMEQKVRSLKQGDFSSC